MHLEEEKAMETTIIPGDAETIAELLGFMQEYYAYDGLDFQKEVANAALDELFANQALGKIWLICQGSVPVGYVVLTFGYSLEFGGRDAFVDELYIQESYRGQGIGAKALAFVEDAARSMGIRALHLEVEGGNRKAQRFCQSQGFEDRENFHLMSKRLGGEQEHFQT
jgi:GNAT superfamily N-acetyltransferase